MTEVCNKWFSERHLRALAAVFQHAARLPDADEQPVRLAADAVLDRARARQRRARPAQAHRETAVGERLVRVERSAMRL